MFKHNINHKVHVVQENDVITQHKWFTTECYDKRCSFYRMLNIYRNSKSEENRINMVKARTEYKKLTLRCRLEYEAIKTKQLTEARFKNAKLYWKMLKECAGVCKSNITLSAFEQYFKSVNNPNSPFFIPDDDILYFIERYEQNEFDVMFQELNLPIHIVEVEKAIRELNINKSAGPDMYLNEFFIHGKNVLVPYLLKLFNKMFDIEYFPESWSEGYVIPLLKKGSINNENNYRGITLLSTLGKLFTRVLNNRLMDWADKYSVYIEAQAGFRPNMGTVDNVFVLQGIITHVLNKGKQLVLCFHRFHKSFRLCC